MLTGEEPISAPFELLLCKPRTPAAARRLWRIIHYVPDMTDAELEVRPYRDSDEPAVVALWERLFPDARAWNQPAAYIRRKLAVQRELFLVGHWTAERWRPFSPATMACAAGSITLPSPLSIAGTATVAR